METYCRGKNNRLYKMNEDGQRNQKVNQKQNNCNAVEFFILLLLLLPFEGENIGDANTNPSLSSV